MFCLSVRKRARQCYRPKADHRIFTAHCIEQNFYCVVEEMITNSMNIGIIYIFEAVHIDLNQEAIYAQKVGNHLFQVSAILKPDQRVSITLFLASDLTYFKPGGEVAKDAPNSGFSF